MKHIYFFALRPIAGLKYKNTKLKVQTYMQLCSSSSSSAVQDRPVWPVDWYLNLKSSQL